MRMRTLAGIAVVAMTMIPSFGLASASTTQSAPTGAGTSPSREETATEALPVPIGAITFSELSVNTNVSDQYRARGIRFSGDSPFITTDTSNPTSPVLSGSPVFQGEIRGTFVNPDSGRTRTVDSFSLDVGYINAPGSVKVIVYGLGGSRIGVLSADRTGIVRITSTFPRSASFVVKALSDEPAGFAIDNLLFPGSGRRLRWIAMGDSYSAGVGLGSVQPPPGCDQDPYAYAPRARRDALPARYNTSDFTFTACSGDKTRDLTRGQLPQVRSNHNVASMTIGGNDIDFAGTVIDCGVFSCGDDLLALSAGPITWDTLFTRLRDVYVATRRSMARDGHVYVLSYPIPFARQEQGRCAGLSNNEQNAANALVTRLDDTIYRAASAANTQLNAAGLAGNVHFVDWRTGTRVERGYTIPQGLPGGGQQFASYTSPDGLCNTSGHRPFIHGYELPLLNAFHPNSTGYWHGAAALATAIQRFQP